MNPQYAVILVDSTSHALRIEKLLTRNEMICKLIPVPRHLSSDCGVCVRILKENQLAIGKLIEDNQIVIQSIEEI